MRALELEQSDPPFDVLHDHWGFTAFAFADRISTPVVHTLHGPFRPDMSAFYARHGHKAVAVALSRYQAEQAPAELEVAAVIGNPIVVDDFPFRHGTARRSATSARWGRTSSSSRRALGRSSCPFAGPSRSVS